MVTALTGMNQYASLFLISVGVAFYIAVGFVVLSSEFYQYVLMEMPEG